MSLPPPLASLSTSSGITTQPNPTLAGRSLARSAVATAALKVVCELDPCPGGQESVLVGAGAAATVQSGRLLLLNTHPQGQSGSQRGEAALQTVRHGDQLGHRAVRDGGGGFLRGQDRARHSRDKEGDTGGMLWWHGEGAGAGRRRRRLADIEEVEFSVPSEGGIEREDGVVMTESQHAAAFVNNVADPVSEGRGSMPVAMGPVVIVSDSNWLLLLVVVVLSALVFDILLVVIAVFVLVLVLLFL